MYCKWCGLESQTTDKCSWCGKPLESPYKTPEEETLSELRETVLVQEEPSDRTDDARAAEVASLMVGDEVEKVPPPPEPAPEAPPRAPEEIPFEERLERYFAVMLILVGLAMLVVHYYPDSWTRQFFPLLLISGLLLGVFRIVPTYEDRTMRTDALILMAVSVIVGPLYATLAYILFRRAEATVKNTMLWLMGSYLLIRLALGYGAHGLVDTVAFMLIPSFPADIQPYISQIFPIFTIMLGWFGSTYVETFVDELGREAE